jgi:hypothetical protein
VPPLAAARAATGGRGDAGITLLKEASHGSAAVEMDNAERSTHLSSTGQAGQSEAENAACAANPTLLLGGEGQSILAGKTDPTPPALDHPLRSRDY